MYRQNIKYTLNQRKNSNIYQYILVRYDLKLALLRILSDQKLYRDKVIVALAQRKLNTYISAQLEKQ